MVRIFTHWIVQARDDARHLENQLGNFGCHRVRVITVAHRDKGIRLLDASPAHHVFVNTGTQDHRTMELTT
jgi:hypothetical protein